MADKKMIHNGEQLIIEIGDRKIEIGAQKPIFPSRIISGEKLVQELEKAAKQGIFKSSENRPDFRNG